MSTHTTSGTSSARQRWTLAGITLLGIAAIASSVYFVGDNSNERTLHEQDRLKHERLLGDNLQLEKLVAALRGDLGRTQNEHSAALQRLADLERRMQEAQARANGLEGKAKGLERTRKELAEANAERDRLAQELEALRANDRNLRDQLAQARSDRDNLAAQMERQQMGAQMVNNAAVDAVRGKRERLTVVARRTREIRMAFDLPQHMAPQASFQIISPKGRKYQGADPALSWSVEKPVHEPLAAVNLVEGAPAGARASRVHMRFDPKEKLEPGVYRIDVFAGGTYLNTVLLRLR